MSKKYYSILVGGREPQKVEVGFLEKSTGLPKGQTSKALISVGKISIPNYSRVWGQLLKDKAGKETGEIKFMKWGEDGGQVVEIRFLPNSKSLSKQYQDNVLKLKPRDEDSEIVLNYGINNFDTVTEAGKIEMLKRHTLNGDNESRDPNNNDISFEEHDADKRVKDKTRAIEERNTATGIVLLCKEDSGALVVLAEIFDLDTKAQNDVLVEELLSKADFNPRLFNSILSDAKAKARLMLDKAVQYKIVDIESVDEEIQLITDGGRKKLFTEIEKGTKDKISWVADSYLVPDVYDAFKLLSQRVSAHEEKLN